MGAKDQNDIHVESEVNIGTVFSFILGNKKENSN